MLPAPPSRFAPGLLRHNRRKVTNLGALSAIFLLKNRRKAEFCYRRRDTTTENGRLSVQKRAAFYKTFFICLEKIFPKSVIFFIIYAGKVCYKLANTYYKLCNTYYKLCNKRYKLCNKNFQGGRKKFQQANKNYLYIP